MTRFARAKGSKASNEKLPESATSWSEMKRELLNKNKDIEENKNREKVMQQRQANYQTFLQEREDAEDKNVSWADFPEARNPVNKQKKPSTLKKRSLNYGSKNDNSSATHVKNKKAKVETPVGQNQNNESEESDEEFAALKSQIDIVLESQRACDSDSDTPPQETGIKEEPKEVIVKKVKRPKQKLQILIIREEKNKNAKKELNVSQGQLAKSANKSKIEALSDREEKKIEQKQERFKKQLEKKKLKNREKQLKNYESINRDPEESIGHDVKEEINENSNEIDAQKLDKKLERRKKQKEKKLKKRLEAGLINTLESKKVDEVLTEKDLANIQKKKERRARQAEKRKKFQEAKALATANAEANKTAINDQTTNGNNGKNNSKTNAATNLNGNEKVMNVLKINKGKTDSIQRQPYNKQPNVQKEKKAKLKEKDFQRKQPKLETMFINGKTIEIDYVDGFPVKKDDADRLKQLRKEMISKGLPRSEINIALKLERRRAEKALTREKKNVCFNCRKSGHNLSECPELGKDQVVQTAGTGICFKCGSTEHTHYECKVVTGLDYKFATCFICKEQGHISRQCPDNQRGLYPKGGSCNVCGDVTHLKRDCPKYQTQQTQLQTSLSIETLDNRNPDDFGSKGDSKNGSGPVKKFNKIKF